MVSYSKGDFVEIKNDDNTKRFGKIEEIFNEDGDILFRYNAFLQPSELDLIEEYFSTYELIQTEEIEKEFITNIKEKVLVLKYDVYLIEKLKGIQENTFFYRQKYITDNQLLVPDLEVLLCCNKILNPDLNYIICSHCKSAFHSDCIENTMLCLKCGVKLNLPSLNKLNSSIDLLKKKRISNISNLSNDTNPILVKTNISTNQQQPQFHSVNDDYTNLPDVNINYLIELKSRLKKISLNLSQKTMSPEDKVRKVAKDQLQYVFLYAIEEIKIFDKVDRIPKASILLNSNLVITEENAISFSQKLANQIENIIFFNNKQKTDQAYKEKLKKLVFNLNKQANDDLRLKIICGEISPERLTKMSSEELAPSKLKQSRTQLMDKYLKEQVIKKDVQLVATTKGESMLTMDGEVINDIQEDTIIENNEDNIYNKAMIVNEDEETYEKEENDKVKNTNTNNKTVIIANSNNFTYSNPILTTSERRSKYTLSDIRKFFDEQLAFLKPETRQLIEEKRKLVNS